MEVILKEDVDNLGHRGDVVKVAEGYGRNFLLPRKLAMQATEANKAVIEQMKAAAARRSATEKAAGRSAGRKAGAGGAQLYPQVGRSGPPVRLRHLGRHCRRAWQRRASRSIAARSNCPSRSRPWATSRVGIKLHREVTAHVKVKVVAEAQEEETAEASEGRNRSRVVSTGRMAAPPLAQCERRRVFLLTPNKERDSLEEVDFSGAPPLSTISFLRALVSLSWKLVH